MRITGDNEEGKSQLDNFIDPESTFPVIAVTSRLMSTGVDAQTCKLIVLDRSIGSMTEFKQIIGRGTRINEDYGKLYFTIMDFKRATVLFADPSFDGDPVQIYEPGPDDPPNPPDDAPGIDDEPLPAEVIIDPAGENGIEGGHRRTKYFVDDVEVAVATERVQYLGADGKLITESLKDFTRKTVKNEYKSLDEFLTKWNEADRKYAVVEELAQRGVFFDELAEQVGQDFDAFDLICHVAFDQPALIIVTNPPFGGMEEDGIEANFPSEFRTRETADLFLVLLMKVLKPGGRAGIVLPDGTLFGEGVKTRIKEALLNDCNLHTIVRLPNGVFNPYTGIRTNLLFFTKGQPTTEIWYYEHPYPHGAKSYNKGKPIRIEEFEPERDWWDNRVENEQAWRVSIDQIKAGNYNLDLKNPHTSDAIPGDLDHLLPEF
jgi:hypothetical protein